MADCLCVSTSGSVLNHSEQCDTSGIEFDEVWQFVGLRGRMVVGFAQVIMGHCPLALAASLVVC